MKKLQKALYTTWISRLGRKKVKELVDGTDAGRTILEKSSAIVESTGETALDALLLEGFSGYFHQTVFLRHVGEDAGTDLQGLTVNAEPVHGSVLKEVSTQSGAVRALVMATQRMVFLPDDGGGPVKVDVPFPVAVRLVGHKIEIRVLTMQSTVEAWSNIVGQPLERMLSVVSADALSDQTLSFLREAEIEIGDYINFSRAAVRLIKRPEIKTYSGTMEVGTVGSTKHDTVRGRGKKPLRESMPEEFDKLVSASRITNAEVEMGVEHLGLKAGSRVALYPTVGKIAFRSNLQGCNPDEFVDAMAKP